MNCVISIIFKWLKPVKINKPELLIWANIIFLNVEYKKQVAEW